MITVTSTPEARSQCGDQLRYLEQGLSQIGHVHAFDADVPSDDGTSVFVVVADDEQLSAVKASVKSWAGTLTPEQPVAVDVISKAGVVVATVIATRKALRYISHARMVGAV